MRTRYRSAFVVLVLAALSLGAGSAASLVDAVKRGDDKAVTALVQQRVDVNSAGVDGSTALMWAVHRNSLPMVDRLLRAGANVSQANRFGMTPLSMAAEIGNAALVERLLKAGANPNAALAGGETPLMTAARTGNADAVRALLARGAQVNAAEHTRDQTALMWAAAQGQAAAVKALIEAGADIKARSTELKSFHLNTYIAGRKDANPTERLAMFTPVLFAARAGHLETVRTLLDAGADANDVGPDSTPALHIAIINAHWQLAAMLVERGADVKVESPGGTALHHIGRVRGGKFLMKVAGAGLPMPVMTGSISAMDLAKLLLSRGADPNARMTKLLTNSAIGRSQGGQSGITPLMMAQIPADPDYTRVLLAAGANPTLTSNTRTTVLMMAAGLGLSALLGDDEEALENLKIAIDAGLDVNAKNDDGDTALHGAAFRNYLPIVQYLIDHGATLDVKNKIGWTPLMEARWTGRGLFNTRPEAEALLRKAYAARGLPQIVPTREEAIEKLFDTKGGPIISCPDSVTVQSVGGQPAVVNYPEAVAQTRRTYGKLATSCTPPTGSAFPVGSTTVTCTSTDDNGRSDSCTVLMKVLP